MDTHVKCFTFTGPIQEEEEKEAQETQQKKEKEGSISVRPWARLATAALWFFHPPDSSQVMLFLPLPSKNLSHPASVITLEQETYRLVTLGFCVRSEFEGSTHPSAYLLLTFTTMIFLEHFFLVTHHKWTEVNSSYISPSSFRRFPCDWPSQSCSLGFIPDILHL